jgi:hypothetical protein
MFLHLEIDDTRGGLSMKKILIVFVGLLLMVSFGCSSEDTKNASEKAKETVIEAQDKAAAMSSGAATATKEAIHREATTIETKDKVVEMADEAATATQEAGVEAKDKAEEMGHDAVKASKKMPAIEGC